MKNKIDPKNLISLAAAAKRLGVHRSTLSRWCDESIGPAYYLMGDQRRFHPADLDAYVASRRTEPINSESNR